MSAKRATTKRDADTATSEEPTAADQMADEVADEIAGDTAEDAAIGFDDDEPMMGDEPDNDAVDESPPRNMSLAEQQARNRAAAAERVNNASKRGRYNTGAPDCPQHGVPMTAYKSTKFKTYFRCQVVDEIELNGETLKKPCGRKSSQPRTDVVEAQRARAERERRSRERGEARAKQRGSDQYLPGREK